MLDHDLLGRLRATIRQHTHADEKECVEKLLAQSSLSSSQRANIEANGRNLVEGCRGDADKAGLLDQFMQQYSLSSREGVALMCLAESLLRVPDKATADALIAEKILSGEWEQHKGQSDSLFVNASTWGLMLTGQVVSLDPEIHQDTGGWVKKVVGRLGEPVVRGAIRQAMKIMGEQYVLGRTIDEAMTRGKKINTPETRFSFDMLGEGARTLADADKYYHAYMQSILKIGAHENHRGTVSANGISVKLSALHPRYEYVQEQRVLSELLPKLRELALAAKSNGIGFTIDAEEADRLDISLTLFQALVCMPELAGWDGLGFVLQAYGKRAPYVIDWLTALCQMSKRKITVRLVKGAYWDSEIKIAQEEGFNDYPVYTRKVNTDLSYQVCAEKLLANQDVIFPQFATHNAYSAALILALAEGKEFEFQRLHGMGDLLHLQLAKSTPVAVRVYAPVGAHKDLLPYLVRRLLENGANSSFVNRFLDNKVPVDQVISDVQSDVEKQASRRHNGIAKPEDIFRVAGENREHTHGVDLSNPDEVEKFVARARQADYYGWTAGPMIGGGINARDGAPVYSPADNRRVVGHCRRANEQDVHTALELAHESFDDWNQLGGAKRHAILAKAADIIEQNMAILCGLISLEAGRTLNDGVAEVREAVDFLRYYGLQAEDRFGQAKTRKNPFGDVESRDLEGRGVFFCISPWNFPLAIFVGQIAAALAAGNTVLAKPADTTPLVAAEAVRMLHDAGVPADALHLLPGSGRMLGEILNSDPRVKGIAFTGSTGVAQQIYGTLLRRQTDLPIFIAETGGQNTMLVDSSALPEQVVDDAIRSAFLSAGQRCSALRVMYIQDEVADHIIDMLKGAMKELTIGKPWQLDTDVGPVIDSSAQTTLNQHIAKMKDSAVLHYACDLPNLTNQGTFVAPHLFELKSINELEGEVFGPILHVIRYKRTELPKVINDINGTGFGLTLGVHSRIEGFADSIVRRTHVGNNYINRNMVGAVPGVNPFGGQGLSGTGPKAGGPLYINRFANTIVRSQAQVKTSSQPASPLDQTVSEMALGEHAIAELLAKSAQYQPLWAQLAGSGRGDILEQAAGLLQANASLAPEVVKGLTCTLRYYAEQAREHFARPELLPGPTGETNELFLVGRGSVVCAADEARERFGLAQQVCAALAAGNSVFAFSTQLQKRYIAPLVAALVESGMPSAILSPVFGFSSFSKLARSGKLAGFAWHGSLADGLLMQREIAEHHKDITPFINEPFGDGFALRFAVEKTKTNNIVATGGNTMLLSLAE